MRELKFNKPPYVENEMEYVADAVASGKICGDGAYTRRCSEWIKENTKTAGAYLTTSCTQALEMAAILTEVGPGDEVILPSFTFVSTANAFALRGAQLVFVDIRPDTNNIDETLIEDAITEKTKVIVPVHYAGVGCEMDTIMDIAQRHHLMVVEDAAQGVMASYKGRALGSIGDFGCFSFHETKNYSMGEGGAILIKDPRHTDQAEIIREKGTDRSRFLRGQVDKYSWVSIGSSFLPSDINAAYLWPQLLMAEEINNARLACWDTYYEALLPLQEEGKVRLPVIPEGCQHNAHMFYVKAADLEERGQLISWLKERGVQAVFHYVPLHSAAAGKKYGRFHGEDRYTTKESECLLRLPMYYGLTTEDAAFAAQQIIDFYRR